MTEVAAREALHRAHFFERLQAFGPAMRFVLLLARARVVPRALPVRLGAHAVPDTDVPLPPFPLLWDLAERYHPEQTWLAVLWTRRERSLDELVRTAPREPLARGLIEETLRAQARGLWSCSLIEAAEPAQPPAGVVERRNEEAAGSWSTDLVPPGLLWGVRAALRSALLEPNETRRYPR